MVFLVGVAVLLAGAVAALAMGRIDGGASVAMASLPSRTGADVLAGAGATDDRLDLSASGEADAIERMGSVHVAAIRFDRAPRGYRMEQVDAVLDRVAYELGRRDEIIAVLRARLPDAAAQPWPGSGTVPAADTSSLEDAPPREEPSPREESPSWDDASDAAGESRQSGPRS